MKGVTHLWKGRGCCHIGALLEPGDKQAQEVYRIKGREDHATVSDMLDEGHFLAPTVERRKITPRTQKRVMNALVKKYEGILRREGESGACNE